MIRTKPEYETALYPLSQEEFAGLRASIEARGVDVPILVDEEGYVLDGHHRFAIAGQDCPVRILGGLSEAEKLATIYQSNFARRNLSPEQKAELRKRMQAIALRLKLEGKTQEQIGACLSVARETVRNWIADDTSNGQEANTCIPDGRQKLAAPAKELLLERVAAGEPQTRVAADLGITQQRVAQIVQAERKVQAIREAESEAATACGIDPVIYHTGAVAFLENLEESADLLLTDPPYMTDVPDLGEFLDAWLLLALSKVKPTGRAYICTGSYPEELHAYLERLLSQDVMVLDDVLVWTYRNTLGPSPSHSYKRNWQAIFYLRGHDSPPLRCETLLEQFSVLDIGQPQNRLHSWQKPDELGERLIRHATKPGETIIDPFAGTGSFLVAATKMGRYAYGCESDGDTVALAETRGCVRG